MIASQSLSSPNFLNGFRTKLSKSKLRNTVTCAVATAPAPASSSSTLYDVLGIRSGATCHEIKAAYRRLAREVHPDTVADHRKDESASEFMRVHSAYATLSDPDKRANYDRNVVVATAGSMRWAESPADRRRPVYGGTYSRSPRTWETDQCW